MFFDGPGNLFLFTFCYEVLMLGFVLCPLGDQFLVLSPGSVYLILSLEQAHAECSSNK